jgi:hypothetical protein
VNVPTLLAACALAALLVLASIRMLGLLSSRERELIERSNLPMKSTLLRVFAGGVA